MQPIAHMLIGKVPLKRKEQIALVVCMLNVKWECAHICSEIVHAFNVKCDEGLEHLLVCLASIKEPSLMQKKGPVTEASKIWKTTEVLSS